MKSETGRGAKEKNGRRKEKNIWQIPADRRRKGCVSGGQERAEGARRQREGLAGHRRNSRREIEDAGNGQSEDQARTYGRGHKGNAGRTAREDARRQGIDSQEKHIFDFPRDQERGRDYRYRARPRHVGRET